MDIKRAGFFLLPATTTTTSASIDSKFTFAQSSNSTKMKFSSFLSLCLSLSVATASPTPTSPSTSTNTNVNINATTPFHLKTVHASDPSKNNLYIYAFHTGAGLNDAVLTSKVGTANAFTLNGTRVQFQPQGGSSGLSFGFVVGGDTNYAAWEPVQINAGATVDGFSINGTELVWNSSGVPFDGWLACDWYHNSPQVFWLNKAYNPVFPSSCSKVGLEVEITA